MYTGCTYNIKLDLGEDVKPNYLGVDLFDAGTKKKIPIKDSGLINSLTFKNSIFRWSVGDIWPGQYYLQIMLIDGLDIKVKSKTFFIEDNIGKENC